MTTAFSSIVAAVIATLNAAPAVCEVVYRARVAPVPETTQLAVNVQFEGSTPQHGAIRGAPIDWQSRISVECYAKAFDDNGDIAVDALLQAVYERIAADTTLAGLVDDIQPVALDAENSAEGMKTGWVKLSYIAIHRTTNASLEAE